MRGEALMWLKQAERDLEAARHLYEARDWFASVFWCNQTGDKALKALLIASGKAVRSHNLLELLRIAGDELGVKPPREVERCARYLNPHYVVSRYPDAANGLPYEAYEEDDVSRALSCAEVILGWVEQLLR
ncbi:MAG: HEPN domain-containing protein [Desulfurococcales archaeon]|nr:HEPN domain-containing protein [Desulfurococcales archaeon]MCE4605160.1 HEPN domain-containing protein [Desulfurococcales archaeon]